MPLGERFDVTLEAARLGAEWAWRALYEDLAPAIAGYLRARNARDPEDVTGEVFLQIVRDLDSFHGSESDFRAWAFTISHHRLLDERRHHKRRPAAPTDRDVIAQRLPVGGDAEAEALVALETHAIAQVLAQLSADQQDVLMLRIVGGLTVEEVARATGKTAGAVKALQRRGLQRIRKELARKGVTLWTIAALTWAR